MSSAEFYDDFITYQIKSGINDRIYQLYKRLCKLGLSNDTHILEIGCGIGTLTYLLSRKIKRGRIEAVDISKKSIEFAKSILKSPNISFFAANILEFEPGFSAFDFLLLFDVIEHIPEEDHLRLFKKISGWMNPDATLFINLPNPNYILFDQQFNPQSLQEIDQPVFIDRLTNTLAQAGLQMEYFETYSVWVKQDYQFLIIKKEKAFTEQSLQEGRNVFQKINIRFGRYFRKLIYRYPKKGK
ncbi:MAG TPA: class I SAM-dependent methyltransferase [Puia sp.]